MAKKKHKNNSNHQRNQSNQAIKVEKTPELLAAERKVSALAEKRRQLETQKAELSKKRATADKIGRQIEQQVENTRKDLQQLEANAFEIRRAIDYIAKLELSICAEQANGEIINLLDRNNQNSAKNSQNDDEILAVAVRYKLSDVVLYTEDKNLKNKAKALGVQTN